jgi:hypothetical protein
MSIPAACPECGDPAIDIVSVPPNEHGYGGWQTVIECAACDERVFARELEA